MSLQEKIKQSKDLKELLELLIPGKHTSLAVLRSQILSFAKNPVEQHVLIIGGIGTGKSTIARVVALARWLHFLEDDKIREIVKSLKYDGPFRLDKKLLDFYDEMNLSGLVESLAQTQLFGVVKGAGTDVAARRGIFEQVMYGHAEKDKETKAAQITGGVVLLDEIGDLPSRLQPQLLSVMTGAEVFPVGGEGNPSYGYRFRGSIIAATWQEHVINGSFRPDLLSRFSMPVLRLPSLNMRRDEFAEIVPMVVDDINKSHCEKLDELKTFVSADAVAGKKITAERERKLSVTPDDIEALKREDWDKRANLRGLYQVLQQSFHRGISISDALKETASINLTPGHHLDDPVQSIVDEILTGPDRIKLGDVFKNREKAQRERFAKLLRADSVLLAQIAEKLGCDVSEARKQLNNLSRDRRAE